MSGLYKSGVSSSPDDVQAGTDIPLLPCSVKLLSLPDRPVSHIVGLANY